MKKAIYTTVFFAISLISFSFCNLERESPPAMIPDFITFGDFYGECVGPQCVSMFKAFEKKVYKDTLHKYPNIGSYKSAIWVVMPTEKYTILNDKFFLVPDSLFGEKEIVFGQPDSHDQGGIYLEVNRNGMRRYWYFDNDMDKNPAYMRDYIQNLKTIIALMKM